MWGGNGLPGAAPACPWPLRVRGHPTAAEAGLVRCYLRAVARHDLAALRPLVNPAYRVTAAQLAQTAGARACLATATFATSPIDTGVATVRIDFADGATGSVGIEIVNPQAAGSWRLDIGTAPRPRGASARTASAGRLTASAGGPALGAGHRAAPALVTFVVAGPRIEPLAEPPGAGQFRG